MRAGVTFREALYGPLATVLSVTDAMLWDAGTELKPAKCDTEHIFEYASRNRQL
jgi:hypothetical protein